MVWVRRFSCAACSQQLAPTPLVLILSQDIPSRTSVSVWLDSDVSAWSRLWRWKWLLLPLGTGNSVLIHPCFPASWQLICLTWPEKWPDRRWRWSPRPIGLSLVPVLASWAWGQGSCNWTGRVGVWPGVITNRRNRTFLCRSGPLWVLSAANVLSLSAASAVALSLLPLETWLCADRHWCLHGRCGFLCDTRYSA